METLRPPEASAHVRTQDSARGDATPAASPAGRPAPTTFAAVLARAGSRPVVLSEGGGGERNAGAPLPTDSAGRAGEGKDLAEDPSPDGARTGGKRRSLGALEDCDERAWAERVTPGAWALLSAPPVGSVAPKTEARVHPGDVAALAERFVTRLRVGHSSKGEVVDLCVGRPGDAQIEVRLIRAGHGVEAVLRTAPGQSGDSARLAERVAAALEGAGVSVEPLRAEPRAL